METTIEQQVAMDEALVPSAQRNSKAYKEYYAIATGEAAPKPKASARRTKSGFDTSITPPTAIATLRTTAAATPRLTIAAKGKQTAKAPKAKSPFAPSEVAMTEAEQLKLVLKRSRQHMHISQHGGSSTDEGTGFKLGVPDVPTDELEEELPWNSSDDEGADDQEKVGDDDEGDEGTDREEGEEYDDDEDNDDDEDKDEIKDNHVTLTLVKPNGQQESSSVSSQFVTSMLNPTIDVGMESIFETTSRIDVQTSTSVAPLPMTIPTMTSDRGLSVLLATAGKEKPKALKDQ
nr:hypothetical protein [Tanacetum cinerariifolium]